MKKHGRIKANPYKQVPTNSYCPPLYYESVERTCRDCGAKFLFSAEEQRAWYEEFGIPHYATANRCDLCRPKHKANGTTKQRYDEVCDELKTQSDHPHLNYEFGMLAFMRYEATKEGRLETAVAALKRAIGLNPKIVEAYYWLARCYEEMGNSEKSGVNFDLFIAKTESKKKGELKRLLKDARRRRG